MDGATKERRRWPLLATLFAAATLLKLLVLAPSLYHSTDFEVHRNWLAVTYSTPLKNWYSEDTSEWTLDYPPLFGYFQWVLSQVAVVVDPDLVRIVPLYEPSAAAEWFQRISVMVVDVTLVFGVMAWCIGGGGGGGERGGGGDGRTATLHASTTEQGVTCAAVGALILLNSALFMVDHIHFQYNGFLIGLLLLSMGLIRHGKVLLGGATFACLLMLKHLFLALAPLYFVYLLRSYCCCYCPAPQLQQTKGKGVEGGGGSAGSKGDGVNGDISDGGTDGVDVVQTLRVRATRERGGGQSAPKPGPKEEITNDTGFPSNTEAVQRGGAEEGLSLKRLAALGSVVLCIFLSAVGPLCVSGGWTKEACMEQLGQLGTRLFPFGRGLVHAYWAPNAWALYLFLDRVSLAALKLAGVAGAAVGKGSTTGGLVRTEVMVVLPSVPAGLCAVLSLLACWPALLKAWKRPSPEVLALGVVHCSLSAFLVGFHVHEKALLVPAVVSALLAFRSAAAARAYLRLSFLAAFAAFPLLPGAELRVLKVILVAAHITLATSLLEHKLLTPSRWPSTTTGNWVSKTPSDGCIADGIALPTEEPRRLTPPQQLQSPPIPAEVIVYSGQASAAEAGQTLWTVWDKAYVVGAGAVFLYGEVFHPRIFGDEVLPFLPLMAVSVYGAVGVVACWRLSVVAVLSAA